MVQATFSQALAPGRHCLGLLEDGDLVAFLGDAIHVTPSLSQTIGPPQATLTLTLAATAPGSALFLLAGAAAPSPLVVPGIKYQLEVDPASMLVLPVIADASGMFQVSVALSLFPPGTDILVQAVEVSASAKYFSNSQEIVVP
jgi:hypothetical protein